jgi:hypothetical protein
MSLGAAAGAVGVLLFLAGAVSIGELPDFDSSGTEIATHLEENRTRIQLGCALDAAAAPFLIWFLVTVVSLADAGGPGSRRAGLVAFGCGVAYVAVFLVDVSSLAVGALRPESMLESPELARALRDFEWVAIGIATPLGSAMLAALAALVLREKLIWPRWLGWLAALAALAYALRLGTIFTDQGPFAADGVLGLYFPVAALAGWILIASLILASPSGWSAERRLGRFEAGSAAKTNQGESDELE